MESPSARGGARQNALTMWIGRANDGQPSQLGSATEFRVVGENLCHGADQQIVARYSDGTWHCAVSDHFCTAIWSEARTAIRFENRTTGDRYELGVFEMIGIVGNMVYVEREQSRPIAFLDAAAWRSLIDSRSWTEVVFLPCEFDAQAPDGAADGHA